MISSVSSPRLARPSGVFAAEKVLSGICYDSILIPRHDRKMDRDRTTLLSIAGALRPDAVRMLRAITGFAELPLQEKRTSEILSTFLERNGFKVERGIAGMETAFRAEFPFGRGKAAGALLCEMDALPGLGHAWGHTLGGVASACAAAGAAPFGASPF